MISRADLKLIYLDFDGVLIQSNAIKDKAFDEVLRLHLSHCSDELLSQARKFHFANNALPRQPKFEHIVNRILCLNDDELVKMLVSDFGRLTTSALIDCDYVEGALEFLEYWHIRLPLVVVSATPQAALDEIIGSRGMAAYFSRVLGAGLPKADQIAEECVSRSIAPKDTLYIGDSPEDYLSAIEAGTQFVGIHGRTMFADVDVMSFPDLLSAQTWLLKSGKSGRGAD